MTPKTATLTVQKWGNSLAVRIPAALAKSVHFHPGTPVHLAVEHGTIVVKSFGKPKMTLTERLDAFDPDRHGGEAMPVSRIGLEKF